MTPISIRINHMRAQTPFYAGFLLPDGRNAIYIAEGSAHLLPVVPFAYDGLYAQDGESIYFANVPNDAGADYVSFLYYRLLSTSALDFLFGPYDEDTDSHLLVDDGGEFEIVEYDEYGREK